MRFSSVWQFSQIISEGLISKPTPCHRPSSNQPSIPTGMTFQDENVVALLARLRTPGQKSYATAYWDFLTKLGPLPSARQHGISDKDAQAVRIKLAGLV
jgi:hypothetical protein